MKKVKVYSTPTCPWCIKAKSFLKEKKIDFKDFDVSSDEKAKNEMVVKSGQMGVPVIDIEGKIIVGFDENELTQSLGA